MAEIEYQVDEMLFKMNALAGTSNLPEKPPMYYTDSDTIYGTMGEGDAISSAGGSEEKFELHAHKIDDNLFIDPHLGKVLHLDSIGADVLSPEAEKQLRYVKDVWLAVNPMFTHCVCFLVFFYRSHIDFELFRQLQLQRQEGRYPSGGSSDVYASSLSTHTPPSGASSSVDPNPCAINRDSSRGSSPILGSDLPILNSIPYHPIPSPVTKPKKRASKQGELNSDGILSLNFSLVTCFLSLVSDSSSKPKKLESKGAEGGKAFDLCSQKPPTPHPILNPCDALVLQVRNQL